MGLFTKSYISLEAKKYQKEYKEFLKVIKKYDHIAIFRHLMPDFDALGSQFGLATWLKENFPNKDIKVLGDNHIKFTPSGLFPETDKVNDEWFNEPFLGIVVDVGDKKRIADPRFEKAEYLFKIDHHPHTENIFNTSLVDTSKAAAAEFVACILLSLKKYNLSQLAAKYFYIGIVGDSGRFMYGSTSPLTFEVSSKLIETGLNITKIYEDMYTKSIKDLDVLKFIIANFKVSEHGVAYYVLTQDDLNRLGLACEQGKENVNFFSNYEGFNIWCSITEDITEPCFRISIRSRNYTINGVAKDFKGGGHAQAAGAQIKDLTELDSFIKALDQVVIENTK